MSNKTLDAALAGIQGIGDTATTEKQVEEATAEQTVASVAAAQRESAPKKKEVKITMPAPTQYIFRLLPSKMPNLNHRQKFGATENHGAPIFLNNRDTIQWPYKKDKNGDLKPFDINTEGLDTKAEDVIFRPRIIRFVFGVPSIFEDEQGIVLDKETNRSPLLDNPENRDALVIVRSEKRVYSTDMTLFQYLWCNGQCQNQHPYARRAGRAEPLYSLLDFADNEKAKVQRGEQKRKAFEIAATARENELRPHAKFLGIPFFIFESGQERDLEAIREDYKDFAYNDPDKFLKTYNDPSVKMLYLVRNAAEKGFLSIGAISPGQAHWTITREFISQLPGDKPPYEHLANFALSEQGADFAMKLRDYNTNG